MHNWQRSLELDPNHADALVNMGNVEILVRKSPAKVCTYVPPPPAHCLLPYQSMEFI